MLSLGVPGDTTTAIIMGALMIQGITTGPLLMLTKPVLFRTIIFAVFVANFFMFAIQASTIKYAAKIVQLPKFLLIPMISVFCVTGVISLNNRTFDLIYMLLFIILGYVLEKNDYPIPPLTLGFILGGMLEENLRRSIVYYGNFTNCLKLPSVGTLFVILGVIFPIVTIALDNEKIRKLLKMKDKRQHNKG
jgi:putative tricarboxylic transport membrane protein